MLKENIIISLKATKQIGGKGLTKKFDDTKYDKGKKGKVNV